MKSCCWTHAARGKPLPVELLQEEEKFCRQAFRFLDRPSFILRLADVLGRPVSLVLKSLPQKHQNVIHRASEAALHRGLRVVTRTVNRRKKPKAFSQSQVQSRIAARWHTAASFGVGAAGGFLGVMSLPIELPLTTAIILRSIVRTAEEFGMDLDDPRTQLECLYILSLGAEPSAQAGEFHSAYWASRAAFAHLANEASGFLIGKTAEQVALALERRSAPVLVRFLAQIASRFEVVVSEKLLAEALPIVGALGGAAVNAAFANYFSEAARYHFGLRALEIKHGRAAIDSAYRLHQAAELSGVKAP